jgi:hypothetical protein
VTARDRTQCAYCGEPASTADHLPPKQLFTPPLPDDLITVPACVECNNGASTDDEVFRNELSIMAGSFGESANAAERIQPTLRGISRNKATLSRIVLGAVPVEHYSARGVFLGEGFAVPMPSEPRKRVLSRVVRGLYWHHFDHRVASDRVTLTFVDKSKPDWRGSLSSLLAMPHQRVLVGDGNTFQYFYGQAADDPGFSFWLLVFFKGGAEQIILGHTDGLPAP